jgi:hypothetical protein
VVVDYGPLTIHRLRREIVILWLLVRVVQVALVIIILVVLVAIVILSATLSVLGPVVPQHLLDRALVVVDTRYVLVAPPPTISVVRAVVVATAKVAAAAAVLLAIVITEVGVVVATRVFIQISLVVPLMDLVAAAGAAQNLVIPATLVAAVAVG